MSKKRAIIVDLDGTLANCDHRVKFLEQVPKDWDGFYSKLEDDLVNTWCLDIINAMNAQGVVTLIVTGRDEKYRAQSTSWLKKYEVRYEHMYMREHSNHIDDSEVKRVIYENEIKNSYDISFVLDDRLSVVKMWRELELTCLQCDWGDF